MNYGALWSEIETHALLWEAEEEEDPKLLQVIEKGESYAAEECKAVFEAQLVTGKLRVEYQWRQLDETWRKAYEQLKAAQVYFDHNAIAGVAKDAIVDPRKILSSRFVLTNKGGEILAEAELKARWILGGHRDAEVGKYPTMAPTASLLGHNLLRYEDVSASQQNERSMSGFPPGIQEQSRTTSSARWESARLWYLKYKATLKDIHLHELKLIPGMFVAFHPDGRLRALVTIHVDDTRYAGDETAKEIWDKLHERLKFGQHRRARDGWQKFCGRYERQDPETFEFYYTMADYILGQINWAARQGRYDLSYGVSHCQQLVATGKREAMEWTAKLIQRAQKDVVVKLPRLGCGVMDLIVIAASDAAFAQRALTRRRGVHACTSRSSGGEGTSQRRGSPEHEDPAGGEMLDECRAVDGRGELRAWGLHPSGAGRDHLLGLQLAAVEVVCEQVEALLDRL